MHQSYITQSKVVKCTQKLLACWALVRVKRFYGQLMNIFTNVSPAQEFPYLQITYALLSDDYFYTISSILFMVRGNICLLETRPCSFIVFRPIYI